MDRRHFIATAGLLAASSLQRAAAAQPLTSQSGMPPGLLERFLALPGTKSAQIDVDSSTPWRAAHDPDAALFCGSAFKTFVLTTYLQQVEAGRISEDDQLPINDAVRSVDSPVFDFLTGTASGRVALEAMITHSDNTATDAAMLHVGADKVRSFLKTAGLTRAQIPDSTRRFFAYIAGYPPDADVAWSSLKKRAGESGGPTRPAINPQQTMVCPASEFVAYYKRALAGEFFQKKETLTEFKRIQAMADAIAVAVPPDTPAYMKGGSITWDGFYCMALAGQMIVGATPVTLCMTLNWTDRDGSYATVASAYKQAVASTLSAVQQQLLQR